MFWIPGRMPNLSLFINASEWLAISAIIVGRVDVQPSLKQVLAIPLRGYHVVVPNLAVGYGDIKRHGLRKRSIFEPHSIGCRNFSCPIASTKRKESKSLLFTQPFAYQMQSEKENRRKKGNEDRFAIRKLFGKMQLTKIDDALLSGNRRGQKRVHQGNNRFNWVTAGRLCVYEKAA